MPQPRRAPHTPLTALSTPPLTRARSQALILGCVPVTVTDGVHQPFEPEINWPEFSLHVAEADIPKLHDKLAAFNTSALVWMQARAAGGLARERVKNTGRAAVRLHAWAAVVGGGW